MIYLVLNIALYLIVAAGIGVGVGWLLRQQRGAGQESEVRRDAMDIKSRIPQLETSIRNRDREVTRLSLELQDSQARIPQLEETIRDREDALLEGERNLRQFKDENSSLRGQADANGSAGGSNFAVLEDADLSGFDDRRDLGDEPPLRQLHEQIDALLAQVAERDQSIAVLEANLSNDTGSTNGATTVLESRIEALQSENAELTRSLPDPAALQDQRQARNELQQQLNEAGTQLAQRDSEIHGLTERLDALTRESAEAANDQSRARSAERDLQIATSNAQVSDLEAQAEQYTREISRMEGQLGTHAADRERLHEESTALRSQLETLRAEVELQKDELAESVRALEQKLITQASHFRSQAEGLEASEQQIESMTRASEALQRQVPELRDAVDAATSALGERESELIATRERLSELEAQLSERDSSLAALGSTIAKQEQSLLKASDQARSSDSHLEQRGNELGEVRAAADAASSALAERESELVGLKDQIAANAEELAQTRTTLEQQRDELVVQIPELEAGISERDQRLKDLEAEIATAAGKAGDIDAKDQQLNELRGQLERSEAKAGALNESLLEQEGSLDERRQRIESLLDDLAQKDEAIGGVSAEAAAVAQRCEKLEEELNGAQTTVTGLEASAAERELAAQAEVAELQRLIGERTAEVQELQTQVASRPEGPEQGEVDEHSEVRELDDSRRQITLLEREQGRQQMTMQVLSQQLDDARQTHARLSETIAERDTRIAELESGSPAKTEAEAPQPGLLLSNRPDDCDDLQRISGIGAALENALNELGIYRIRQIAALNETDIKWVDGNLRGFKGRIIRDAWVEQADALSFGG